MSGPIRAALLAALVLAGCARGTGASASDGPSPSPSGAPSSSATEEAGLPPVPDGIPDEVWVAVISDLAQRTDAATIDPTVVSAVPKTWNDGSLGCPEPGQMYTQALVDGYQIVLEIDGERYDYRTGSGTDLKLCENNGLEGG